jgi:hypothetical protein
MPLLGKEVAMANKRRVVVEKKTIAPAPREGEPRTMSWSDWLIRRYARYWYWVGMLFMDMAVFLEMQRSLGGHILVAMIAVVAVVAVQFAIYLRLWGSGALFGEQVDTEKKER